MKKLKNLSSLKNVKVKQKVRAQFFIQNKFEKDVTRTNNTKFCTNDFKKITDRQRLYKLKDPILHSLILKTLRRKKHSNICEVNIREFKNKNLYLKINITKR